MWPPAEFVSGANELLRFSFGRVSEASHSAACRSIKRLPGFEQRLGFGGGRVCDAHHEKLVNILGQGHTLAPPNPREFLAVAMTKPEKMNGSAPALPLPSTALDQSFRSRNGRFSRSLRGDMKLIFQPR
jgi:hypothetical protein